MKYALLAILMVLTACGTPPTPSAETPTDHVVTMVGYKFEPSTITIKVGDTIEWQNDDAVAHIVNLPQANSPELKVGDSWAFQFNEPGTYAYGCGIHPSMKGTVVVE